MKRIFFFSLLAIFAIGGLQTTHAQPTKGPVGKTVFTVTPPEGKNGY